MNHLHPRNWPVWLGIAILRLLTWLPWRVQMALGKHFGLVLYKLLKSRRTISCINLELAFPELSAEEHEQLNKQHFISLAQGLIEAAFSWWGNDKAISRLMHVEGEQYLIDALEEDKGVLCLSAHFTSLELGGRMMALRHKDTSFHVVYRPHQNELIESIVANVRSKRYGKAIAKDNIRGMIRSLKGGHPLWYAQDQSYQGKNSVVVPFFGIPTSTNSATSRFASMTGASVIPFFTLRLEGKGYLLRFLPPLNNFPSDDIEADTLRINQLIEAQVREFPAQYLWTHKRFKDQNKDFYNNYLPDHPDSDCQ